MKHWGRVSPIGRKNRPLPLGGTSSRGSRDKGQGRKKKKKGLVAFTGRTAKLRKGIVGDENQGRGKTTEKKIEPTAGGLKMHPSPIKEIA